ncbi:MAG TPA: hypothetical protein DDY79_05970, partial [Brevundimonas sp.]|nr:hypothetical protein [Brevundimonas sp.]
MTLVVGSTGTLACNVGRAARGCGSARTGDYRMNRLICLAAIAAMLGAPVAALAQESGANNSSS